LVLPSPSPSAVLSVPDYATLWAHVLASETALQLVTPSAQLSDVAECGVGGLGLVLPLVAVLAPSSALVFGVAGCAVGGLELGLPLVAVLAPSSALVFGVAGCGVGACGVDLVSAVLLKSTPRSWQFAAQ